MSKTASRTILLKGRGYRVERKAGGAITPGHLVTLNNADALVVHGVAKGKAAAIFAVESEHLNNSAASSNGIDTAYAAGDFVQAEALCPGCEVNALLAAAAAAIVEGDLLESAGDGTLRKRTAFDAVTPAPAGEVVAMALEAVDNSGGGATARIRVMVV